MAEDTSKTGIESDEEEKRKAALARIASEIITDAQKSANGITAYTLKAAATSKLPDLQNLVPDALAIPKQETRVQTSNRASDNARRVISYCLDNVDSIRSIADSFNAARQSASAGARFKNWLDFGAKVIGLIVREPRSIVLGIDYLRGNISPDQILRDEKTWQLLANKKAQIGKAVELFKPEISAALQQFGAENLDVNAVVQAVISKPKELREIYTSFSDIGVIGQVREADAIYAELQRAGKLPASTVEQLPVLTKLQTLNELYNKAKLEGRSLFTNVESAEKFDKLNSWYEKLKLENRLVEVEVACAKKPAPGWMGLIKEAVDLTSLEGVGAALKANSRAIGQLATSYWTKNYIDYFTSNPDMASKPGMRKSLRPELFAAVAPLLANTDRLKRINDALYNGQWFPLITEVINFAKDNPEFANYARDNSEVITNVAKAYFESNPQMADRLRGWINLDMQILDLLPPLLQQIEKLKAINDHFNNGEWLPLATKALDLANQYPDTVGKALKVQSKVIADVAEGFCAQPHMQQQLQWLNFNPKVLKAIEPLLQQPARLKQLNDAFVNAMIVGQLPGIEALYQQLQQSHALPAANTSSQKLKVLDQYYKTSPHLPKEVAVRLESAHNFHDSIVLHGRLAALDIVDKAVPKPDWVQLASQAMSFVRQDPAVRHFVTAHTHMIGDIVRGIFVNSQILGVDRDNQVALQMVDIMLKHLDDLQVIIDTYASAGMVAAVAQFSATVRKLPELERFFAENADSIADMAQKIILSIPVAREQLTDRGINLSNMELLKEVVRNIKEFDSVAATKAGITNGLAAGARILVNNPAMRAELYSQVAKNVTGITVDLVGDQLQNTKLATLFGQDRSRGELTRFMLEQITREHQFQVKDQSTGLIDLNKSIEKLVKTKRDLTKLSAGNLKEIAEITKNTTLNNVVFKDYCIENMSFAKSTINNADFQGTDFRNVDFSHTVFKGKIGFKGATLDPETLKTLLPAVRAAREVFTRSAIVLDGVKLVGDFSGMDVSGISFQHADFSKAEITGANLANCNLTNAVISEQQLGSAKSLYETHSNIKHFRDIREKHVASDVVSKLADDVFGKASSRNKNQFKAKLEESLQKRLFKSENFQNKEKQDKIIHDVLATHESAVARDLPESQVVKYLREALPENTTEFTTEQMNVAVDVLVKNTVIDRLAVRLSHELFKGGETSNRKTDQQRIKKHLTEVFRAIEEEIPNFNYETLVDKEASIVGKLNFSVTQGGKLSEGYGLARLYYDHATTYTWAGLATGGVKTKSTIQATSNFKDIVKGHVVACLTITPKELECVENMANKVSENLFKAGYKTTRKVDAARIKEHLLKEVCKLKQEVGDGFNIEHLGKISRKVTGTLPSQARLSNPPSLTELYYQASSFTLTGMASGGICMPEKNLTENLAQQISKSLSAFYHGHEHEVSVQKQHSHARKQSQARE